MATQKQTGEDIAVLKNDMKWVKESARKTEDNIQKLNDSVDKITQILTQGEGKINVIKKEVFGNGYAANSLKTRVTNLETDRNKAVGVIGFFKWATAVLGIGNIALIIKLVVG
jgi:chromosome segregation ATPase